MDGLHRCVRGGVARDGHLASPSITKLPNGAATLRRRAPRAPCVADRQVPGRCSHLSEVMSRLFAAAWGATPAGCRLLYSAGDPTERAESWLRELPYGNGH